MTMAFKVNLFSVEFSAGDYTCSFSAGIGCVIKPYLPNVMNGNKIGEIKPY